MTVIGRQEFIDLVKPDSMMSDARIGALWDSLDEVIRLGVPGDIVMCGVWRGGAVRGVLEYLSAAGAVPWLWREVWVYDTFDGMSGATAIDVTTHGERGDQIKRGDPLNCEATLEEFSRIAAGHDRQGRLTVVTGDVVETLSSRPMPEAIAILHLDMDFYRPTAAALSALYPRVGSGGITIIDDYGHWDGCRAAVDKYFAAEGEPVGERIDDTGILIRKVGA